VTAADVDVVRDSLRVWRQTGAPAWDLIAEDIEVHDHDIMDAGEYRGRAGVERWLGDWEAAWSDFGMRAEEFIDAGEHRVLVFVRMNATGRESKVRVEREDAILYALTDGLIRRIDYYNNRPEALAAAGIRS
jgi:ketosteroid isomerase-like protein